MEERRRAGQVDLLSFGFNQDSGCFSCGTSNGFRVYNCEPFRETFRREFSNGGIGTVEMLFRCNILAIVGGGPSPRYPPNKVMIWDDHQGRCIGELSFRSQVRAVKLRRDRIVVALEHKVLVYNFADLRLLHSIETLSNPLGLVALSPEAEHTVLACPGLHCGQIRIELYDVKRTKFIQAHTSSLACVALCSSGRLLASASERGTLVRLWSTADGSKLQELRRGADPATVTSLAFSRDTIPQWLALASDKGTVHVFALAGDAAVHGGSAGGNAGAGVAAVDSGNGGGGGWRSYVGSVLPVSYFSSERSFAQFRLPEETRAAVGFGQQPHTLLVVGASGSFYVATFDPARGGICEQRSYCKFIELGGGD